MTQFLTPVLVLIIWNFVILAILLMRRIPAMKRAGRPAQDYIKNPALMNDLPDKARWAGDNYNHLFEQPVLFYVLMFYLALTAQTGPVNLALGLLYVGLRIVHSLIQVTYNNVLHRFGVFLAGSLVLMLMAAGAVINLL